MTNKPKQAAPLSLEEVKEDIARRLETRRLIHLIEMKDEKPRISLLTRTLEKLAKKAAAVALVILGSYTNVYADTNPDLEYAAKLEKLYAKCDAAYAKDQDMVKLNCCRMAVQTGQPIQCGEIEEFGTGPGREELRGQ